MHSYIIGLVNNYRGQDLELQLSRMGATFEIVPGVLASNLPGDISDYVDQESAKILLRREMTVGEVGCALAHRAAYSKFLVSPDDFGMVFEDDARVMLPFDTSILADVIGTDEPTVLTLYSWGGLVAGRRILTSFSDGQMWQSMNTPLSATGYILNRAAAAVLLEEGRRVTSIADWPAEPASRIRFLFSYPWVVEPSPMAVSTLNGSRVSAPIIDNNSRPSKVARHLFALLHITWMRHHTSYVRYSTYFYHEFYRLIVEFVAARFGRRIVAGDGKSPFLFLGKVLGNSRRDFR